MHHREGIVISQSQSAEPVIYFRNIGHQILSQHFYSSIDNDAELEKERIVEAESELVLEQILVYVLRS